MYTNCFDIILNNYNKISMVNDLNPDERKLYKYLSKKIPINFAPNSHSDSRQTLYDFNKSSDILDILQLK